MKVLCDWKWNTHTLETHSVKQLIYAAPSLCHALIQTHRSKVSLTYSTYIRTDGENKQLKSQIRDTQKLKYG